MRNLRQSLTITFFASNGATVVNFIVAIILARLLTPAERERLGQPVTAAS